MTSGTLLLGGAGLGAGLMYLLDPDYGRRRRAVLRDGLASAAVRATRRVNLAARDLGHRASGLVAELGPHSRPDRPVPSRTAFWPNGCGPRSGGPSRTRTLFGWPRTTAG